MGEPELKGAVEHLERMIGPDPKHDVTTAGAIRLILQALQRQQDMPTREEIAQTVHKAIGDAWIGRHQAEVAADALLALWNKP